MQKIKITLPMLTVFLGFVALLGTAAVEAENRSQQDPQWVYTTTASDPLDPENYEPYQDPNGLEALCQQTAGICGIIAPADPNDPTKPDLSDSNLQDRITNEDTSNGDVFLLPKN